MKRIKQILTPLALLALTTTLSFATVYSDGEDGTTTGWRVYDNSPSGATIENSYDETKQSKVIVLNGEKRKNAYMIGDKKNSKGWKNSSELTMKWSMNFSEKFKISVYLKTKKGNRVLYYDAKNSDRGFYKKKYIRLGLGSASNSGKWVDISRNLEADLQKHEPSNYIKMVSGMKIQGSGKIDNLELLKGDGQPTNDLQISDIQVIKLKDDYAKVAWKLNHKATGQVEYGTTTDYGNFSNKEDSFKLTYHRQSLRGLEAGTTYHYRVISEDEAGNRVVGEDKSFTTTNGDTFTKPITLEQLKEMIRHNEDLTEVNTSQITDMSNLFNNNKTFNQDIGNWDVSHVTNMHGMFHHANAFNQDIGKWDVSHVTDMSWMLSHTYVFNQDITNWNVSHVTNMNGMFTSSYMFNQDIGKWDVSHVADMGMMFASSRLFNQDINKWDVSSVTNMSYMFYATKAFNQNINSWETSQVTNMQLIFEKSSMNPLPSWYK